MKKVLCFVATVFSLLGNAQVVSQKVGNNPGVINASAALDVESVDKGFLPPRMSTINRNAILLPASGLIVFNTTSNVLEINTGTPILPVWTVTTNADLTGDVTSLANATTVIKINGVPMSGLATGLLKNTTATGKPSIAIVRTDYAEPTTELATGILKNTTGTGVHTIAVAEDFPILNQNTSGNAATVTTNANLTGMVTSIGNATTVVTNANLSGEVTSIGNMATLSNEAVIGKKLTNYTGGVGTISQEDNIIQAIQKLDGNAAVPSAVTLFTANGTYSPAVGVKWITVECVGGGGAGGTTPVTAATRCAASGGGGGGGYRKVLVTKSQLVGGAFVVTIGNGGTVNAVTGIGGAGGTSSLATLVSCSGGSGGAASIATTNIVAAAGGAGGTSTSSGCSLMSFLGGGQGSAGYSSVASTTRFLKGGNGGNSFLGFGGLANETIAGTAVASAATLPSQYGGGGAGVAVSNSFTSVKGGQAGSPGVVIITEFF
jgi:hypothetical protein